VSGEATRVVSRSVWKIRTRFPVAEISLLCNAPITRGG
jgi:hypothetical protein